MPAERRIQPIREISKMILTRPDGPDSGHLLAVEDTRIIMSNERKVAIITGASQGIGAALVKAYRDRNYRVVATSRSIKQGSDPDILAVAGDIGDPATAERSSARPRPLRTGRHAGQQRRRSSSPSLSPTTRPRISRARSRPTWPASSTSRSGRGRDAEAGLGPHRQHHHQPDRPCDRRRARPCWPT
jgi:hypothetical protein